MYTLFRTIIAPEFASKTDAELLALFEFVEAMFTLSIFGARANEAAMLMAAHWLTMAARQSEGGASAGMGSVRSRGAGGLSIAYAGSGKTASTWDQEWLSQTNYGAALLALKGTRAAPRVGIC